MTSTQKWNNDGSSKNSIPRVKKKRGIEKQKWNDNATRNTSNLLVFFFLHGVSDECDMCRNKRR